MLITLLGLICAKHNCLVYQLTMPQIHTLHIDPVNKSQRGEHVSYYGCAIMTGGGNDKARLMIL